jgi:hypothetical protein
MVMSRLSPAYRLAATSPRTDRTSRTVKDRKLPAAARNQKGLALSAREASARPAMNNVGLNHLIDSPTCLSLTIHPREILAPPSDNGRRRSPHRAGPGRGDKA